MKFKTFALGAAIALASAASAAAAQAAELSSSVVPDDGKKEETRKKADLKTVVFATDMTCHNCVKKMNENLQFLRGVKDLEVSLEKELVTIKYDPSKTDETKLAEAIRKLGYKAEKVETSSSL